MKHLLLTITILLSTGCASMVQEAMKVTDDPMKPSIEFNTLAYDFPVLSRGNIEEHFSGSVERGTGEVTLTLYTTITSYRTYSHWSSAKYLQGGKLVEKELVRAGGLVTNTEVSCDRFAAGCAYHEDMVLYLDRDTLEYWAEHGAVVRFVSKRVNIKREVKIQPEEVKAFLKQLNQALIMAGV